MKKHLIFFILICNSLSSFPNNKELKARKNENDSTFKDWVYTPDRVYGLIYLHNVKHKQYCKIKGIDDQTFIVNEYDPANTLVKATKFIFFQKKISVMNEMNEWNQITDSTLFINTGNDEFIVKSKHLGANSISPCKKAKYIFKNGVISEIEYLTDEDSLCMNVNGFAISKFIRYTDKTRIGLIHEVAYFDNHGDAIISRRFECHKVIQDFDERGNLISRKIFGLHNEPVLDRFNVFKQISQYNKNDELIKVSKYDTSDKLIKSAYGVASVTYEYDDGFKKSQTNFDENNLITRSATALDSIAVTKYKNDAFGNEIERRFYDGSGKAIDNELGIGRIVSTYNSSNLLASSEFFDSNDSLIVNERGIHRYLYRYDNKGHMITKQHFDKSNNPTKDNSDQVYEVKYNYDDWGRELSQSFWKNDTTKMERWNGFHAITTAFDSNGKVSEYAYYDQDGNFTKGSSGYSRQVIEYNESGQIACRKFFDGNTPIMKSEGAQIENYHAIKYVYDKSNRVVSLTYYNIEDQPTVASVELEAGNIVSCTKIVFEYQGNRISGEKFYVENNEIPSIEIDCFNSNSVNTSGINIRKKIKN
ncbi:MAG TPA: hypothetical protein VKR53_09175 [Puia sp.]|nr:hypothetical protein [Puia sp.]